VRRYEKEITDPAIVDEILQKSELCRIGLADAGAVYIVPLNFGYKDGILYFHSAPEGRKMDIIRKCDKASFEITQTSEIITGDRPCHWTAKYRSVMGNGTMEIVCDRESKISGLNVIMKKYGAVGELDYDDASLQKMILLKLHIESLTAKQSGNWHAFSFRQ
jgi:uncharacterized protein